MGSDGTPNTGIQTYLQVLNSIRNRHGATALTWNDDLDAKAQQWARMVANSSIPGVFFGPFGENLTTGTRSYSFVMNASVAEVDEFSVEPVNRKCLL